LQLRPLVAKLSDSRHAGRLTQDLAVFQGICFCAVVIHLLQETWLTRVTALFASRCIR
jgi:hypothetical protein